MQTTLSAQELRPTPIRPEPHPASDYFSGTTHRDAQRTTDLDALLRLGTGVQAQGDSFRSVGEAAMPAAMKSADAMYDPMEGTGIALGLRAALLCNVCLGLGGFLVYEAWSFLAK